MFPPIRVRVTEIVIHRSDQVRKAHGSGLEDFSARDAVTLDSRFL